VPPLPSSATFAVMYLLGFSLKQPLAHVADHRGRNSWVDDAIVMIEKHPRVTSKRGDSPLEGRAEGLGADRLHHHLADDLPHRGFLIPLLFMGDVVGRLFREFARHALAVTIFDFRGSCP